MSLNLNKQVALSKLQAPRFNGHLLRALDMVFLSLAPSAIINLFVRAPLLTEPRLWFSAIVFVILQ